MEMKDRSGQLLLGIASPLETEICTPQQFPVYTVYCIHKGQGVFHSDFGSFPFTGPVMLFATPMQLVYLEDCKDISCTRLQFHSDFYCIEYHRQEVACNGLLFNNIYIDPLVSISGKELVIFESLLENMKADSEQEVPSETVSQAYLQLFLAKSSAVKIASLDQPSEQTQKDEMMEKFRALLDKNYLTLHKPSDMPQCWP